MRKVIVAALAITAFAGCGATADKEEKSGGQPAAADISGSKYMVPNAAGGGYDITARTAAKIMGDSDILSGVEVFNLEGAAGTVGLQRIINEKDNGKLIMQMGLGVVGASYTADTKARLADTTPIAKLIEEAGVIAVPKDSPYKTIEDLIKAWKADPKKVVVGGGSNPGGPDHLMPMQIAKAAGIDPKSVSYVAYDGGGELLPALLSGKIAFGASGLGEFQDQVDAGELRVLAVTSAERLPVIKDVPTLTESGVDLVFTNWRGVVAPPEISDADKKAWVDVFTKLVATDAWKKELETRGWTDAFMPGDEFGTFLAEQDKMVADTLTELGLQ